MTLTTAIALAAIVATEPPVVVIDRDNVEISQSCTLRIAASLIVDADGDGIIHIIGSDLAVSFAADSPPLRGATPDQPPDSFKGTGIIITGRNIALIGARVSGYKVGIHAIKSDGSTIAQCDVSGNYAQRLKSTPQAEDASDWLFPHDNDQNQWITQHGAGLCVEDCSNVTLRDIRARRTQNGIILDAVNDSKVYDCDCSFLSGWGLAMWRSSRNIISRNAFDFCVRGYSHAVYNRGQDSAGILMFEQCCDNIIVENSATHGGDGFFGFAGKEALGEVNPREDLEWYRQRGNNDNTIVDNDFSFAAAHGLELTFSFQNEIAGNKFRGNAICGIWGGYSQAMIVHHNRFSGNGEGAYGLERGGVNIEHGAFNIISQNSFDADACGIHLWWDEDDALSRTPWAKANQVDAPINFIIDNGFQMMQLAIQLRDCKKINIHANRFMNVNETMKSDQSRDLQVNGEQVIQPPPEPAPIIAHGTTRPVGARAALVGRENIIMTEWGPWDHASPLLQFIQRFDGADEYRLLNPQAGDAPPRPEQFTLTGDAEFGIDGDRIHVRSNQQDTLAPYQLTWHDAGDAPPLTARGMLGGGHWTVRTFASPCDPREDVDRWRAGSEQPGTHSLTCDPLDLRFGSGGMTEARGLPVVLPRDHFGCIATRTLTIPEGRWRVNTNSDDGIRVWMNDQLIIDDWTWHAPKKQSYDFEVTDDSRESVFRVEYFELDGFATLAVEFARLN